MKRFIHSFPLIVLLLLTIAANCQKDIYNDRYQLVNDGSASPPVSTDLKSVRMTKTDIPSAQQMQKDGFDLGEMQIKLLQKIEELTLYVIELKKENEEIRTNNEKMEAEIEQLKNW